MSTGAEDVTAAVRRAVAAVRRAVAAVTDPEYPDLTIEDLGILERIEEDTTGTCDRAGDDLRVTVALVPTVLGCPTLRAIEADVVAAARGAGATEVDVVFLTSPRWSTDRIRPEARHRLGQELTIAVRRRDGGVTCPVCGSTAVQHRSDFGPTLCREVWWCAACRNPVEVLRA